MKLIEYSQISLEMCSLHCHNTIQSRQSFSRIFAPLALRKVMQRKIIRMQTRTTPSIESYCKIAMEKNLVKLQGISKVWNWTNQHFTCHSFIVSKMKLKFVLDDFFSSSVIRERATVNNIECVTPLINSISFHFDEGILLCCAWPNTNATTGKLLCLKNGSGNHAKRTTASILFNVRPLANTCLVGAVAGANIKQARIWTQCQIANTKQPKDGVQTKVN